jgi:hypothetical protein
MFGQEIEEPDAQQQESGYQHIPITPLLKKRHLFIGDLFTLHIKFIRITSSSHPLTWVPYLFPLFEISDATINPIPNPINNPIVTRLISSPKTNPTTIATPIAISLRLVIQF